MISLDQKLKYDARAFTSPPTFTPPTLSSMEADTSSPPDKSQNMIPSPLPSDNAVLSSRSKVAAFRCVPENQNHRFKKCLSKIESIKKDTISSHPLILPGG